PSAAQPEFRGRPRRLPSSRQPQEAGTGCARGPGDPAAQRCGRRPSRAADPRL
ncbi:unnamed protein product, partial [Rangifer tarandus platyrhynchus]